MILENKWTDFLCPVHFNFASAAKSPNLGWLETQIPWNKPRPKVIRIQPVPQKCLPWADFRAEGGNNSVLWLSLLRDLSVIPACYFCLSFSGLQLLYAHLLQWAAPVSLCTPGMLSPNLSSVGALPALEWKALESAHSMPCCWTGLVV